MVDRSMMHLEPKELMQYFDGTLENRRVREHLSTCVQCRSRLKDLALTRIMLDPPRSESPGEHVPPQILARYVEDTLSMEQNRAVEEHMGECRRCLSDLVSLRTAMKDPLEYEPSEAAVAAVQANLEDYRRITPLGELSFKRYRDQVNLAFRPPDEPDDPEAYSEQMAKYRFPFKRGAGLRSRVEDMVQKSRFEAPVAADMALESASYGAGEFLQRHVPSEPSGKTVSTETALLFFFLDEREGKRILTIQIRDQDGVEPLPGVEITVTPIKDEPVTLTTDDAGQAVLEIPQGPSVLRIHLEKIYELDLRSLL